jgi:hypothetical protein
MKLRPTSSLLLSAVILFGGPALGQITVDATGPHKAGDFRTTGGSGGGVGRKLAIQLAIEIEGTPFNADNGRTVVYFLLTNTGKQELKIPLSPNGGDVESTNSFRELVLYMTLGKKDHPWGKDRQSLQAGTELHNRFVSLYGSDAMPGTLGTLAPGELIRVRAEVAVPYVSGTDQASVSFVAHAMMDDRTIRTVGNKRLMDSREIGIATSPEYTPQSLFKSPH